MPRLFTGLEIPDRIAQDLVALRGGLSGARWIDADDLHITLRFIGDVGETDANEIHSALDGIRRAPLTITLTGIDVFGGDKPRALIATIKPVPPLLELQAEHERLMRRIGLPPETRKFVPHVTLARLRQTSPRAVADFLSIRGFIPTRDFTADHVTLFSARDSVGGGPYVAEAAYPLQPN